MSRRDVFFASCPPGLEPVLLAEARELGLAKLESQVGGVYFEGTTADVWRANLCLRTAIRIFQRLGRFEARDADGLYRGAKEIDWSRFVEPEGTLVVDSQTRESELFHTHFIQQRTKDAIVDQFRERTGTRPSVELDDPDLRVHVHLFRDRATVSVDTSGGSLHKRGWRAYQGRAPMSEVLAAGIVMMSGWDRRAPLLDPFCGSGTLLVEAAALAAGVPPGSWREFGFERWPGHDAAAYAALKRAECEKAERPRKLRIVGSDLNEEQVAGARENAESAGFGDWLELEVADVRDFAPRSGWNAWIVTNPPYGLRVGDEAELVPLYEHFGELLRERCDGYHVALLSGNADLAKHLRFKGDERTQLANGTIDCRLMRMRIGADAATSDAPGAGARSTERRSRRRRARGKSPRR